MTGNVARPTAATPARTRVMLLLGEGGHTKEMLRLAELLGDQYDYAYTIVKDDEVSEKKIATPGPIFRVIRPRDKSHHAVLDTLKTVLCAVQALTILLRVRPAAVISTGPSVAVPVFAAARLLRCKVVFIETGSRLHALSTTGRLVYRYGLADVFLVQWPELLAGAPRAIYAGRLW